MLKKQGMTLIEMLMVVVVIGLLVSLAIPTYQYYLVKAQRHEARTQLLIAAGQLERYYGEYHRYTQNDGQPASVSLPMMSKAYQIVVTATTTTYILSATPLGSQALEDTECGTLTLNEVGKKGANHPESCW